MPNFGFHLHNQIGRWGWPMGILSGFGTNAGTMFEIIVGPDVNDLIQGADFGVPECAQLRIRFPVE